MMIAGLGIGAKLLGVGRFLRHIPWQVWAALTLVIVLWLGVRWHNGEVKAADQAGYERAMGEVRAEQERIRALAERLKVKAEAVQRTINEEVRINHVKETSDIHARADALRLRGPSGAAAACPASRAGLPGGAGGAQAAGEAAELPGMAVIPWRPLVDHGERCDVYRAQVSGWQAWHAKQSAAWAAWLAEANAAATGRPEAKGKSDGR